MTADSEGNQQEFRVVLTDASDPTIEANPLHEDACIGKQGSKPPLGQDRTARTHPLMDQLIRPTADSESRLSYPGWKVSLAGFFGVMVSFSAVVPYTFGLFLKPLSL
jgi:hypothetical protein